MITALSTCLAVAFVALVVVVLGWTGAAWDRDRAIERLADVERDRCAKAVDLSNANLRLRVLDEQRKQRAQKRTENRKRNGGKRRKGGKGMSK